MTTFVYLVVRENLREHWKAEIAVAATQDVAKMLVYSDVRNRQEDSGYDEAPWVQRGEYIIQKDLGDIRHWIKKMVVFTK